MEQKKGFDSKLLLLMGVFSIAFALANFIAFKTIDVGPVTLTAGLLAFPIMFLTTDTVTEVYGKPVAKKFIKNGFLVMIIALIVTQIAVHLPPSDAFEHQEAFEMIFGAVPRVTLASLVAYLVSQSHDVWAFNFWGKVTNGKHLWLRNNLSTIVSQAIDSIIFIGIAFGGTVPFEVLWTMILGQWIVKWGVAVLETPLVYVLVAWARK